MISLYQIVGNCDLRNASSTAMGILDVLDLESNKQGLIAGITIIFCALMHKYNCSIPDLMQVVDNMEREAVRQKIPEFSAAIQYIQGEL